MNQYTIRDFFEKKLHHKTIFTDVVASVSYLTDHCSNELYIKTSENAYYKCTIFYDRDENQHFVKCWNECQPEDIVAESFKSSGFEWVHQSVSDQDDCVKNHKSLRDIVLWFLLVNLMKASDIMVVQALLPNLPAKNDHQPGTMKS